MRRELREAYRIFADCISCKLVSLWLNMRTFAFVSMKDILLKKKPLIIL